ncbi:MAG: PA14 domain-containing protein [Ideonella sp.]|jgi:hypothetical protein|nr:PA14 domain-containing protein [Ideonella sp.]
MNPETLVSAVSPALGPVGRFASPARMRGCAAIVVGVTLVAVTASLPAAPATPAAAPVVAPGVGGLSAIETRRADHRAQLCSSANAVGVGLRGEYFASADFKGPILLSRIDTVVDFDTSLDWPADRKGKTPRSVRWSGWVKAPLAGRYTFHVQPANAAVTVANRVLTGAAADGPPVIEMAAGRFYPITVELARPLRAGEVARLEWTAPHGARFVIPRQSLFMPTETVQANNSARR